MIHGFYSETGPESRLQFMGALLREDPTNADLYLAQFDGLHLPESHGWHPFPKTDFVNIEGSDISEGEVL